MSAGPNGVPSVPAATPPVSATPPPAPAVVPAPPAPQPTPQIDYVPRNPQTGQPVQTPAAPSAQPSFEDQMASRIRTDLAKTYGVPVEQFPSDYHSLLQIQAGAISVMNKQREEQLRANAVPPTQTTQPTNTQTQVDPLAELPQPPGWERMLVQNKQTGQWDPVHPNFADVARVANYNEGVRISRQHAMNQGRLLPEQQKSVEQIVNERMAQEREGLRGKMFMDHYSKELYEYNQDGSKRTQFNPATGKAEDVPSALGIEMRAAAEELRKSGARYDSAADLAEVALTWARERVKLKQATAAQQAGQQPPAQVQQNRDLQDLLNNHQRSGTTPVANSNSSAVPFLDMRSALRADLQHLPDNADHNTLAKALGFV